MNQLSLHINARENEEILDELFFFQETATNLHLSDTNLGDVEAFLKRFHRITHLSLHSDLDYIDLYNQYDDEKTKNDLRAKFCNLKLSSTALESVEVRIKARNKYP